MDKTREQLINICKEKGIKGYSNKKKNEIISMINETPKTTENKITRLSYIGSKFKLLDWLSDNIKLKTGITSFEGITIADIFSGTGVVSHYFRNLNAKVISNDAELYSSIITHAFTCSVYCNI